MNDDAEPPQRNATLPADSVPPNQVVLQLDDNGLVLNGGGRNSPYYR